MAITGSDFYSGYMKIEGFDSVYDAIRKLPEEVGKGIMQDALMQGAKLEARAITTMTPVGKTGNLKRSTTERWKGGRKPGWFQTMNGAGVQINVGPEYSRAKKGYAAHLVEFGTRPHPIIRGAKYKTLKSGRRKGIVTGAIGKSYMHPGAKANPFVRRAFLASNAIAIRDIKEVLKSGIEKAFTRMVSNGRR
jgi:hypothetical protein